MYQIKLLHQTISIIGADEICLWENACFARCQRGGFIAQRVVFLDISRGTRDLFSR